MIVYCVETSHVEREAEGVQSFYILSIFDPTNFGNRLQACALENVISSLTNRTVYSIDNRRPKRRFGVIRTIANLRRIFIELRKESFFRRRLFINFQKEHCAHVIEVPEDEISDISAPIVIGSDQCWNPWWGSGSCELGAQCAVGVKHKIAYAASFGVRYADMPDAWKARYSKWLPMIDCVAVREFASAEIVEKLTGVNPPVVLDPTMLKTADWWSTIEEKPKGLGSSIANSYCLKYVLGDDEASKSISDLCASNGYHLIDLKKRSLKVGPAEFIWLIRHATIVCTDSFHATVFSLLFHTPFIIYERQGDEVDMSSRFDTLNVLFGIDANRYSSPCFDPSAVFHFDWDRFEERLNTYRIKSYNWLKQSLAEFDCK